jgi:RNA-directed DNA polymerase
MRLIRVQRGRCRLCGEYLLHADGKPQSPSQWEQWFKVIRKAMVRHLIIADTTGQPDQYRLVHAYCHERHPADEGTSTAANCNASTP